MLSCSGCLVSQCLLEFTGSVILFGTPLWLLLFSNHIGSGQGEFIRESLSSASQSSLVLEHGSSAQHYGRQLARSFEGRNK